MYGDISSRDTGRPAKIIPRKGMKIILNKEYNGIPKNSVGVISDFSPEGNPFIYFNRLVNRPPEILHCVLTDLDFTFIL